MNESLQPTEHWKPASEAERELVLKELDAMLSSYHFRGSKRYPAFLKYVVDAALEGRSGDLKERTLGVEVFARHPDYDTSADPVVRFSASEVRKRIAQYYHENGKATRVQIELPLGSYVPEFQFHTSEAPGSGAAGEIAAGHSEEISRTSSLLQFGLVALAAVLAAAAAFGVYTYRKSSASSSTVSSRLWAPLVSSNRPILIVVGTSHPIKLGPEPDNTSFIDHMTGPYHHVSVATATALANLAGVLRERGAAYEIKEDAETSLTDIRSRPVILVGATNNTWTMRLVSTLRYRFVPGPLAQIQDSNNPGSSDWTIDFTKPYSSVVTDYAVVARYHDATTEGPVLVIAGLGPYGTEAASAFVGSQQYLEQIAKQVAQGWEGRNLEMVLKTEVIDGKAGPPILISSSVW